MQKRAKKRKSAGRKPSAKVYVDAFCPYCRALVLARRGVGHRVYCTMCEQRVD